MTDLVRASLWRLMAARHRAQAAQCDMAAAAITASASLRSLIESVKASERYEVGEHPDLMYLDVQLDGFYADPRERRDDE